MTGTDSCYPLDVVPDEGDSGTEVLFDFCLSGNLSFSVLFFMLQQQFALVWDLWMSGL